MLTIISKTGKVQKQVFIIARYEITKGEQTGRLIHIVRSVKQVKGQMVQNDYQVITFNDQEDARVTCQCPANGDCCHKQEVSFVEMRRCNTIAPVKARRVVAKPARELRNVYGGGEYWPQYRDENGIWQHFKDEQGHKVRFLGGHEYLAHEFIKVDSDECRNAVLAELQRMFDEQNAAYEAEQARKTAQSQRRVAAPLNGNRGFSLCKSWAEIEAERAARKAVA